MKDKRTDEFKTGTPHKYTGKEGKLNKNPSSPNLKSPIKDQHHNHHRDGKK